jgi:hypothetical protein
MCKSKDNQKYFSASVPFFCHISFFRRGLGWFCCREHNNTLEQCEAKARNQKKPGKRYFWNDEETVLRRSALRRSIVADSNSRP